MDLDSISVEIEDAARRVHAALGHRRSEMSYEAALSAELQRCGHAVDRQVEMGTTGECITADLLVDKLVPVLIYAVEPVMPEAEDLFRRCLARADFRVGYVLNFSEELLDNGMERIVVLSNHS